MLPYDQIPKERLAIGDLATPLDDELGLLNVNLAIWMARDDSKADANVTRAGNQVLDSIEAMLRQLHQVRARMVAERHEDQGDDDGLEPYCAECGHWIGMFHGLDGWQHFRGDPAPGGKRELYDAGHEASPAWCEPPGRGISPAQASILGQALADAERFRRDRVAAWCAACQDHPAGACEIHVDDLDQADAYRDLAAELAKDYQRGQS